ncbi:MAG: hypothetical protein ACRD1L_05560 [Terriglobales bacterium]
MNPPPRPATEAEIEQLRIERRSYIVGTLVVWGVILVSMVVLIATMKPELFANAQNETLRQALARVGGLSPLTVQQQLLIYMVELAGAVALFFLNWRFSVLLQRPHSAFNSEPGTEPYRRWLWWVALLFNSMFYVSLLIPQLVITYLLASWGKEEIARRRLPPPPPASEAMV